MGWVPLLTCQARNLLARANNQRGPPLPAHLAHPRLTAQQPTVVTPSGAVLGLDYPKLAHGCRRSKPGGPQPTGRPRDRRGGGGGPAPHFCPWTRRRPRPAPSRLASGPRKSQWQSAGGLGRIRAGRRAGEAVVPRGWVGGGLVSPVPVSLGGGGAHVFS